MKRIIFVLLAFLFVSCERIPQTAQGLYQKGIEAAKKEDYGKAIDYLEKALEKELSAKEKEIALITLANAYFNEKDFENAALKYEEFLTLYPASPFAKDALFRLGVSYLNLIKGPEWDQTFTKKAIDSFDVFIMRFPDDKRVEKAKLYKKMARKVLAEHEIYIAGTYDMLRKFTASIDRYEKVKEEFSDIEPADRLNYLLGRAYFFTKLEAEEEIEKLTEKLETERERLKSKDEEERKVALNRIKLINKDIKKWQEISQKNFLKGKRILEEVAKNYPQSPYGKKAKLILKGEKILDVEPVENPIKHSIWWKIKNTL
ncbi:MAG: outer membrane protein assembly factor BamD [Desulfurobacteriaceae bacterium]